MGAPELADLMHYETRIIRGHLDQSQQRLLKARHHVASKDLTPVLEDVQKLQDWRPAHGGVPVDVVSRVRRSSEGLWVRRGWRTRQWGHAPALRAWRP